MRNAGVTVTLPKPTTSTANRFGKQDFRYVAEDDVYICPAGERLATHLPPKSTDWFCTAT